MAEMMDTRAEQMDGEGGPARYWLEQIKRAEKKREAKWLDQGRAVVKRYREERDAGDKATRFNILWSNTETLKAALLARMAKPDVRRRWADRDPLGRQIAICTERAVEYTVETENWQGPFERALEDHLLAGRGVVWLRYEPKVVEVEEQQVDPSTGMVALAKVERLAEQKWCLDHVWWEDYLEGPAKCWKDVPWIARKHLYTRERLEEDFPQHAAKVQLTYTPDGDKKDDEDDAHKRAVVWEIWDGIDKVRVYVAEGYDDILEETEDPYRLEHFWPIPVPLDAVTTNDTRIPVPEYEIYKAQAEELDAVTGRITALTDQMKRRGVYDAAIKELSRFANLDDGKLLPSENFAAFASKGGFQGTVQWDDITGIAQVLQGLYQQRDSLIQTIYEITGISDIIRGSTNPNETATAQRLKGQFGSMRLKKRQDAVQKWVRDAYRLLAEMMCEHVEPEILQRMTGIQVTPEMIQVMRDDKLRSYKIEVETDSTVFDDAEQEKQTRVEFLTAAGGFMKQAIEASMVAPEIAPLAFEMLAFGVRGFKVGRQLEDVIDETAQMVKQKAQQPKQPQADPKVEAVKAKAQTDMQKAQMDAQMKAGQSQADMAMKSQEMQMKAALETRRMENDSALKREQMALTAQLEREKMVANAVQAKAKLDQEYELREEEMEMRDGIERDRMENDDEA